jgi:hypothetical protein
LRVRVPAEAISERKNSVAENFHSSKNPHRKNDRKISAAEFGPNGKIPVRNVGFHFFVARFFHLGKIPQRKFYRKNSAAEKNFFPQNAKNLEIGRQFFILGSYISEVITDH